MKRQLMIAALVLAVLGGLLVKAVIAFGPEEPYTREGIHVVPTHDGADASDGKFRLELPAVPTVIRNNATMISILTRGSRVDVALVIVSPVDFDAARLPEVAGGVTLGFGMLNATWAPGSLAGLPAGTASGDVTLQGRARHLRMWAVAASRQQRFYVLVAIGDLDVAPQDLERVASRIAFVTP